MAFSPNYTADDLSAIVIDTIGKFALAIAGFIALVGLVVLYVWFKKHAK